MPYEWLPPNGETQRLHLWPYRSLPKRGFVWFVGGTALAIGTPLLAVIGSPVLWGLLPFLVLAIAGLWFALQRSYHDGEIIEDLILTPDLITLTRHGPQHRRKRGVTGTVQTWQANPHWVRLVRHETGGPVPHYLTLTGGPRVVELGTFLSESERITLAHQMTQALAALRQPERP